MYEKIKEKRAKKSSDKIQERKKEKKAKKLNTEVQKKKKKIYFTLGKI